MPQQRLRSKPCTLIDRPNPSPTRLQQRHRLDFFQTLAKSEEITSLTAISRKRSKITNRHNHRVARGRSTNPS
ncbi:hypothetical protein AAHA92_33027 [Salvia divinorum]|uniref:Uncharacterized protein n=1 Tax=Salvia divinorum TaxID=28513 RepID=A0ABD1FML8_SALDI